TASCVCEACVDPGAAGSASNRGCAGSACRARAHGVPRRRLERILVAQPGAARIRPSGGCGLSDAANDARKKGQSFGAMDLRIAAHGLSLMPAWSPPNVRECSALPPATVVWCFDDPEMHHVAAPSIQCVT